MKKLRHAVPILALMAIALVAVGCDDNDVAYQRNIPKGHEQKAHLEIPITESDGVLQIWRTGPEQIRAGEPYTYNIRVKNSSDVALDEVVVREQLARGFELDWSTPVAVSQQQRPLLFSTDGTPGTEGAQAAAGGGVEQAWLLGRLEPGESKTIEVGAVAQGEGKSRSCILVDYKPALCTDVDVIRPDIALTRQILNTKGNPQDTFYSCEQIVLKYTVRNTGSGDTREVHVLEDLPNGIQTADGKQRIDLNVGTLAPGASESRQVTLNVSGRGVFEGSAIAKAGNLTARSETGSARILHPILAVDLDGPAREYITRSLTYNVAVTNTSEDPAIETKVRLNLPSGAKNLTISTADIQQQGNNVLQIGRLGAGETRRFAVTYDVTQPGRSVLQATASAFCAEDKAAQAATEIVGLPAVRLEVVDLSDPIGVGNNVTYTIQVKNQGTAQGLNVSVRATLPPELQFVSGSGQTNVTAQGQNISFGRLQALPPGAVAEWRVEAKALRSARVQFRVEMLSDANPDNPAVEFEPTTLD